MSIAKTIELSAESPDSFEDAIREGIKKASETVRGISGAYVKEQLCVVENDAVTMFRVHMQVTFKVE